MPVLIIFWLYVLYMTLDLLKFYFYRFLWKVLRRMLIILDVLLRFLISSIF